jgi:hypothetical protein
MLTETQLSDFMDLVPHIPHLNGLELEFMSMHIDPEPSAGPGAQANGHAHNTHAETNGSSVPNGHSHSYPRTGTYF